MESASSPIQLTPEEAQAALPILKQKAAELLTGMKEAEAKAAALLASCGGKIDAAWEDEKFRKAVYERRQRACDWGESVYSLRMTPTDPFTGAVTVPCTDKTRYWKEGQADYTTEPTKGS